MFLYYLMKQRDGIGAANISRVSTVRDVIILIWLRCIRYPTHIAAKQMAELPLAVDKLHTVSSARQDYYY